jgi:hypothetical protein
VRFRFRRLRRSQIKTDQLTRWHEKSRAIISKAMLLWRHRHRRSSRLLYYYINAHFHCANTNHRTLSRRRQKQCGSLILPANFLPRALIKSSINLRMHCRPRHSCRRGLPLFVLRRKCPLCTRKEVYTRRNFFKLGPLNSPYNLKSSTIKIKDSISMVCNCFKTVTRGLVLEICFSD